MANLTYKVENTGTGIVVSGGGVTRAPRASYKGYFLDPDKQVQLRGSGCPLADNLPVCRQEDDNTFRFFVPGPKGYDILNKSKQLPTKVATALYADYQSRLNTFYNTLPPNDPSRNFTLPDPLKYPEFWRNYKGQTFILWGLQIRMGGTAFTPPPFDAAAQPALPPEPPALKKLLPIIALFLLGTLAASAAAYQYFSTLPPPPETTSVAAQVPPPEKIHPEPVRVPEPPPPEPKPEPEPPPPPPAPTPTPEPEPEPPAPPPPPAPAISYSLKIVQNGEPVFLPDDGAERSRVKFSAKVLPEIPENARLVWRVDGAPSLRERFARNESIEENLTPGTHEIEAMLIRDEETLAKAKEEIKIAPVKYEIEISRNGSANRLYEDYWEVPFQAEATPSGVRDYSIEWYLNDSKKPIRTGKTASIPIDKERNKITAVLKRGNKEVARKSTSYSDGPKAMPNYSLVIGEISREKQSDGSLVVKFRATPTPQMPKDAQIEWRVDGNRQSSSGKELTITLTPGTHTIHALLKGIGKEKKFEKSNSIQIIVEQPPLPPPPPPPPPPEPVPPTPAPPPEPPVPPVPEFDSDPIRAERDGQSYTDGETGKICVLYRLYFKDGKTYLDLQDEYKCEWLIEGGETVEEWDFKHFEDVPSVTATPRISRKDGRGSPVTGLPFTFSWDKK